MFGFRIISERAAASKNTYLSSIFAENQTLRHKVKIAEEALKESEAKTRNLEKHPAYLVEFGDAFIHSRRAAIYAHLEKVKQMLGFSYPAYKQSIERIYGLVAGAPVLEDDKHVSFDPPPNFLKNTGAAVEAITKFRQEISNHSGGFSKRRAESMMIELQRILTKEDVE